MISSTPGSRRGSYGMTLRSRCDGSCGSISPGDSPNASTFVRRRTHHHHHHHLHHHHHIGHAHGTSDALRGEETPLAPESPQRFYRLSRNRAGEHGTFLGSRVQRTLLAATTAAVSQLTQRTVTQSVFTEETVVRSARKNSVVRSARKNTVVRSARKNAVNHSDYSSADEDLKLELNGTRTSSSIQLNGAAREVMSDSSGEEHDASGSQRSVRFAAGLNSGFANGRSQSARTVAFGDRWHRTSAAARRYSAEQERALVHLYGLDDDLEDEHIDVLETDFLDEKRSWIRRNVFGRAASIWWSFWVFVYWLLGSAMLFDTLFIVRCREYVYSDWSTLRKCLGPLLLLLLLWAGTALLATGEDSATKSALRNITTVPFLSVGYLSGLLNVFGNATENAEASSIGMEEPVDWNWLNRASFASMLRQMVVQMYGHPEEGRAPFAGANLDAMVQDAVRREMAELGYTAQQGVPPTEGVAALEAEFSALKAMVEAGEQRSGKYQSEYQAIRKQMDQYHQAVNSRIRENGQRVLKLEHALLELQEKLLLLDHRHTLLLANMRNCCRNHSEFATFIKDHVAMALNTMPDAPGTESCERLAPFRNWLKSYFTTKEDLHQHMSSITAAKDASESEDERVARLLRSNKAMIAAMVEEQLKAHKPADPRAAAVTHIDGVMTEEQFKVLINQQIALYNADRLGLPDYALESSGGSVVSTRCSESYYLKTAQYSILGIGLWYASNSPRTVIQPGVNPGECWAFKGEQGYLVVKLSRRIRITALSLEHIPKSISPSGSIDTAPKEFQVWGLQDEKTEGVVLGTYVYDQEGEPLQYFIVKEPAQSVFEMVELRILSNQGNPDYTCIYRFRVHGELV